LVAPFFLIITLKQNEIKLCGTHKNFLIYQIFFIEDSSIKVKILERGIHICMEKGELRRPILGILFLTLSFLIIAYFTVPAHAEPPLSDVLQHLGFTYVAEVENVDVTFCPGLYTITLYAEFAGYHETNDLSYYAVDTQGYNLIFNGSEGGFGYISPITKTFTIDCEFGLSMFVARENHRYFTQNSLNPDSPPTKSLKSIQESE
jgi:hypothetical protein